MTINDLAFERTLLSRLVSLPFPAFLQIVATLLERMGYAEVKIAGRRHERGRRSNGGCDLTAVLPVPGGTRRLVVQVKQYPLERQIFRRTIDELRGVCLRASAAEAMLVTTATLSGRVSARLLAASPLVPVRLIDGPGLADQMACFHVGAWIEPPEEVGGVATYRIDEPFLDELAERFPDARASQTAVPVAAMRSAKPKTAALPRRS